jgi:hypothetical protein
MTRLLLSWSPIIWLHWLSILPLKRDTLTSPTKAIKGPSIRQQHIFRRANLLNRLIRVPNCSEPFTVLKIWAYFQGACNKCSISSSTDSQSVTSVTNKLCKSVSKSTRPFLHAWLQWRVRSLFWVSLGLGSFKIFNMHLNSVSLYLRSTTLSFWLKATRP